MEAELIEKMRENCDREWKLSRGYSCNIEKVALELKIYSEFLNLRKTENKKWPKMDSEQNNIYIK